MQTGDKFKLTVTRRFNAAAEAVFDAWLDPVGAPKWLFATPNGEMLRADIDPSVGGEFCIVEKREDEVMEHLGEYTVIDRPRRLAFMFTVNMSDDVSHVTVDIAPVAGGSSVVNLRKLSWKPKSSTDLRSISRSATVAITRSLVVVLV